MKDTSYVSEAPKFINQLTKNPEARKKQLELRRTWWHNDNNDANGFVDLEEQKSYAQASVAHPAYTYFDYHVEK